MANKSKVIESFEFFEKVAQTMSKAQLIENMELWLGATELDDFTDFCVSQQNV